jgi:hypothetical protein
VLTIPASTPPAQRLSLRWRAARLGVKVVALLPALVDEDDADDLAALLVPAVAALLEPGRDEAPPPIVGLADEPGGPGDLFAGLEPDAPRRPGSANRATSASGDAAELALDVLRAAAEFFARGALLLRHGQQARGFGAFGPADTQAQLARGVARLAAEPEGLGAVGRVLSTCHAHRATEAQAQAETLGGALAGLPAPRSIVALPLVHRSQAIGVLYGDDGGGPAPLPDTASLEAYLRDASARLAEALERGERRARARRLRALR